jgi:oligopeptide/dipeptide ABC transporter ATP-binding protein
VALVGESGSGKSTIARMLAGLYPPTSGRITFEDQVLGKRLSRATRGHMPIVFQDPFSSINPVLRVGHGLLRALKLHRPDVERARRVDEAVSLLEKVGLSPGGDVITRYPHELSGGQRQRLGFAQALASRPSLILADEPVSMLDVSIRAGILNMMASLRAEAGASILYITHDIASARYVADRIVVMYAGHAVEQGPADVVLSRPKHPYTQLLLSAVPDPREKLVPVSADSGEPPRVIDPGEGCRFRQRCPYAVDECARITPVLRPMGSARSAACHVAVADPMDRDEEAADPAAPAAHHSDSLV